MVLVDVAGDAYKIIDHAPWNGLHLADFVMPFFLFTCGVAVALALKSLEGRRLDIMKKLVWRCSMLFFVGLIVQGSWFDGQALSSDLSKLRICGILQRIAI